MIRTSALIATAAILASLLVHSLGLLAVVETGPEPAGNAPAPNVVEMSEAFEDLAESVVEPVEPEPAPEPEPEKPSEPEPEDIPTSQALVASDNPQNVFAPDTGPVDVLTENVVEPIEPTDVSSASEDLGTSGPENQDTSDQAAQDPDKPAEAQSTVTPPTAEAPSPDPEQQLASLPEPVQPVPTAPSTLEPTPAPVTPAPPEAIVPVTPENTTVSLPAPEVLTSPETDDVGSELAVTTSLRPKLRREQAPDAPTGRLDFSAALKSLATGTSETIESPLTLYQRDGVNLFSGQGAGDQTGSSSSPVSRGPGNSDVTNYVGRVLVHLNRVPVVPLNSRGSARVFFEINPDGTVARVDILDSTGSAEIERAARDQVLRASPFPRPPQGRIRRMSFVYRN